MEIKIKPQILSKIPDVSEEIKTKTTEKKQTFTEYLKEKQAEKAALKEEKNPIEEIVSNIQGTEITSKQAAEVILNFTLENYGKKITLTQDQKEELYNLLSEFMETNPMLAQLLKDIKPPKL
jgi:uncharacterized protein YaiL (DUF2058 family)